MAAVSICTLATANANKDLCVFLFTLELFNISPPTVYLLCDSTIANALPPYKGTIHTNTGLDIYTKYTRQQMSVMPGKTYKTLWEDFMMEKATVMEWAYSKGEKAVFFADSDICFLGPLPQIPPAMKLAVSPHMIRQHDAQRFGYYNAGFLWSSDSTVPERWRKASLTSRYYDQAAVEDLVEQTPKSEVYEFPEQVNYGWWRMYQGTEQPDVLQAKWSIFRKEKHSGICVSGSPLLSIHPHWSEKTDHITQLFNKHVLAYLVRMGKHPPAAALTKFLVREFSLKN